MPERDPDDRLTVSDEAGLADAVGGAGAVPTATEPTDFPMPGDSTSVTTGSTGLTAKQKAGKAAEVLVPLLVGTTVGAVIVTRAADSKQFAEFQNAMAALDKGDKAPLDAFAAKHPQLTGEGALNTYFQSLVTKAAKTGDDSDLESFLDAHGLTDALRAARAAAMDNDYSLFRKFRLGFDSRKPGPDSPLETRLANLDVMQPNSRSGGGTREYREGGNLIGTETLGADGRLINATAHDSATGKTLGARDYFYNDDGGLVGSFLKIYDKDGRLTQLSWYTNKGIRGKTRYFDPDGKETPRRPTGDDPFWWQTKLSDLRSSGDFNPFDLDVNVQQAFSDDGESKHSSVETDFEYRKWDRQTPFVYLKQPSKGAVQGGSDTGTNDAHSSNVTAKFGSLTPQQRSQADADIEEVETEGVGSLKGEGSTRSKTSGLDLSTGQPSIGRIAEGNFSGGYSGGSLSKISFIKQGGRLGYLDPHGDFVPVWEAPGHDGIYTDGIGNLFTSL